MCRFISIISFVLFAYMPLCRSHNPCSAPECEVQHSAHVQLYFSGCPHRDVIQDPREDYEWPGMNADAFYDYFTN